MLSKVFNFLRYYVKTWSSVFVLKEDLGQDSFLARKDELLSQQYTSEYFLKGVGCFESHEKGFLKLKLCQKDK